MDETDVFFNLRLGEIVLGSGHVPTENLLSFTYPHATDVNLAWLFQLLLCLAYRAADIPGTVLLKTIFVLGAWATLYRVAVRRGARPGLTALTLALSAWAAEPRFVERPHLVTFLGLALLLLAVERAEAGRPRMLWWMVPGGLVWANANSCYFLAPTLLLIYALGAWRDGRARDSRRAVKVALAMIPLMFATPSGWHCLSYVANHFRMPYLRPLQEYRHAEWPLDGPYFFLLMGLVGARVLPMMLRTLPRMPDRIFFPLVPLAILGGLRIRFVAELAMLAGPALAVASSQLAPARKLGWQQAAAVLILAAAIVVPRVGMAREGSHVLNLGMEADLVPTNAIDFIERHALRERMYNDLEVGSYLTWRGWPTYPVFQDPRINGYPEEFHAVLRRADLSRAEWQAFLDRFAVTSALISYPSINPRGALFDPSSWALVYRAGDGMVFVRRSTLRGLPEIPVTFSYAQDSGLTPIPIEHRPASSTTSACEWQRRLGDFHWAANNTKRALASYTEALDDRSDATCVATAKLSAGQLALQLGDAVRAERWLADAGDAPARANHGYALLALGRTEAALADFDRALALDARNDEAGVGRALCLSRLGRTQEARSILEDLLARSPQPMAAELARRELDRLRGRGQVR
jgi:hypothetical protein